MLKILCVGNSFSEDASRYVEEISNGQIFIRNLYYPGCSLEQHCTFLDENSDSYIYQHNGSPVRMMSLSTALGLYDWDYITVQQVSQFSGMENTYEPYLAKLTDYINQKCPDAQIVMHQTWSYDTDSQHSGFANYNNNQENMEKSIRNTVNNISMQYGYMVVKTGEVIWALRQKDMFKNHIKGLSLTRDGFHLSYCYGRFAASLTFYRFFTGSDLQEVTYIPELADKEITNIIKNTVNEIIKPLEKN